MRLLLLLCGLLASACALPFQYNGIPPPLRQQFRPNRQPFNPYINAPPSGYPAAFAGSPRNKVVYVYVPIYANPPPVMKVAWVMPKQGPVPQGFRAVSIEDPSITTETKFLRFDDSKYGDEITYEPVSSFIYEKPKYSKVSKSVYSGKSYGKPKYTKVYSGKKYEEPKYSKVSKSIYIEEPNYKEPEYSKTVYVSDYDYAPKVKKSYKPKEQLYYEEVSYKPLYKSKKSRKSKKRRSRKSKYYKSKDKYIPLKYKSDTYTSYLPDKYEDFKYEDYKPKRKAYKSKFYSKVEAQHSDQHDEHFRKHKEHFPAMKLEKYMKAKEY